MDPGQSSSPVTESRNREPRMPGTMITGVPWSPPYGRCTAAVDPGAWNQHNRRPGTPVRDTGTLPHDSVFAQNAPYRMSTAVQSLADSRLARPGVTHETAKLFKNGESQAVRLPKEFRFPGKDVLIKRVGSADVLLPKARSWETLV